MKHDVTVQQGTYRDASKPEGRGTAFLVRCSCGRFSTFAPTAETGARVGADHVRVEGDNGR